MTNVKKAALGLKAHPAPAANLTFLDKSRDKPRVTTFKSRIPKVNSITIKKNDDYDELLFLAN